MAKYKVRLNKTSCVTRWVNADSEEQARQIVDGVEGAPDLRDAEYDYDEDHENEDIISITEVK